jgi:hypothetical protein
VGAAHLAQCRVAQLAGGRLDAALPFRDDDGAPVKGDTELRGGGRSMDAPRFSVRAQAMVDVQRTDVEPVRMGEAQQDHRVEAAAEGDRDRGQRIGEIFCAQGLDGLRE